MNTGKQRDLGRNQLHGGLDSELQRQPGATSLLRSQHGFTLVGLLVTTVMIGVLAEALALSLRHHMPTQRLHSAARQVVSDLLAARRQAIRRNQEVTVAFVNPHTYIIWNDRDKDGRVGADEKVEKTGKLGEAYAGVILDGRLPVHVVFQHRGTATTFLEVQVKNTRGVKTISVSRSGKIKLL